MGVGCVGVCLGCGVLVYGVWCIICGVYGCVYMECICVCVYWVWLAYHRYLSCIIGIMGVCRCDYVFYNCVCVCMICV